MAATTTDQPILFNPFSYQPNKQEGIYADFSPVPLYAPLQDFNDADFSSDAATSPESPLSPVLANSYTLPGGPDFTSWDKIDQSLDADVYFKSESYDSPDLFAIPPRTLSVSPAINPLELSNLAMEDAVPFGRDGLNDNGPLFQSPQQSVSVLPTAAPEPAAMIPPERRYPARSAATRNPLKRKSSSPACSSPRSSPSPPPPAARRSAAPANESEAHLPPKKTAHNMVEKRYRNNLNDKIAALRDCVPALRVVVHRLETHSSGDDAVEDEGVIIKMEDGDEEDLGGLTPAHKLNKATILSKATEYIAHLERRNRMLAKENAALRSRVEGFEMLVMSRGGRMGVWS